LNDFYSSTKPIKDKTTYIIDRAYTLLEDENSQANNHISNIEVRGKCKFLWLKVLKSFQNAVIKGQKETNDHVSSSLQ
jgi:hypothetical protein